MDKVEDDANKDDKYKDEDNENKGKKKNDNTNEDNNNEDKENQCVLDEDMDDKDKDIKDIALNLIHNLSGVVVHENQVKDCHRMGAKILLSFMHVGTCSPIGRILLDKQAMHRIAT